MKVKESVWDLPDHIDGYTDAPAYPPSGGSWAIPSQYFNDRAEYDEAITNLKIIYK